MSEMQRSYRAICFDLDGTLLPMDIDEFMGAYFKRICAYMQSCGYDGAKFKDALNQGTKAMAAHDLNITNKQAFWDKFFEVYVPANEEDKAQMMACADEFYEKDFPHIGDDFAANPDVARAIDVLTEKGYPLVLTTMPMFPRRAVEHRLEWAGVDASSFARLTSYENSKSVKPMQTYYAENLAAMGLEGKDVLMVGNNTMEDLSFMDLGADAYLVTDCLLDPVSYPIDTVKHGSFAEFLEWAKSLPACADPAVDIKVGEVPEQEMMDAFNANALDGVDLGTAQRNAAIVADAVSSGKQIGTNDIGVDQSTRG